MKVHYKTVDRQSDMYPFEYKELDVEFCCEDMESAYGEAIDFGEFDSDGINTDKNINIAKVHLFPECSCFDVYPIKYCPFCGANIDVSETKKTRLVPRKVTKTIKQTIYDEVEI